MRLLPLLALALLLTGAGCKRYAMGEPFKNPPPPILKRDWHAVMRKDLSFTMAIPPGAEILDMPGVGPGSGADAMGVGTILGAGSGDSKDEAGFMAIISPDTSLEAAVEQMATSKFGMQPANPQMPTAPPPPRSSKPASKPFTGELGLIAVVEMPAQQSYEALADEIVGRLRDLPFKFTIDKTKMDLPVGPAMRVKADYWDSMINESLTVIAYTLSDGNRLYAGLFLSVGGIGEEAGFSPKEIMSTFRPAR